VFYTIRWIKIDFTYICFFKINQLIVVLNLYRLFVSVESSTWIFFIFRPSKIRANPTDVVSSLFLLRCRLTSGRRRHTIVPFYALFPLHLLAMIRLVAFPLESKPKHWIHITVVDHSLWTARLPLSIVIKKVISTLSTIFITQPCLSFATSLAKAQHHRSSTCRHHSLSLPPHSYCPAAQWDPQWRTSRLFFASQTTYWHANLCKMYFKIPYHHVRLLTSINRKVYQIDDILASWIPVVKGLSSCSSCCIWRI
jgi:hypothetical protein